MTRIYLNSIERHLGVKLMLVTKCGDDKFWMDIIFLWFENIYSIENHRKVTNEVTVNPDPELENLMNRVMPLLNGSKR